MSSTSIHISDTLTWKQADDDVHVATREGEFAGFIEFDGAIHLVHDGRGSTVGTFATLGDARVALETAIGPVRRGRRASRAGAPMWRRMLRRVRG